MPSPKYRAVIFDLLTALLDSWTLWYAVAGSAEDGRRWRSAYLEITYRTGTYRPYDDLVAEAAVASGLSPALAEQLHQRYSELHPWPDVREVLAELQMEHLPLAVVTNCSEKLGAVAVAQVDVPFRVVVTAERAGFYKPDPRPYLLALSELGLPPEQCLFVAGSAYDLTGTAAVGLPTFWHDRIGMRVPAGAPAPLAHHRTLAPLLDTVLGHR